MNGIHTVTIGLFRQCIFIAYMYPVGYSHETSVTLPDWNSNTSPELVETKCRKTSSKHSWEGCSMSFSQFNHVWTTRADRSSTIYYILLNVSVLQLCLYQEFLKTLLILTQLFWLPFENTFFLKSAWSGRLILLFSFFGAMFHMWGWKGVLGLILEWKDYWILR